MNRLKLSILGVAAAVPAAAGLFLASAAGPNLLQNGDFSNGVTGWSNYSGNPQAVSGAMQLTNGYQGTGNSYYSALQCVTGIQEGVNYTVKGDAFIELGQTPYGAGGLYLHFRTGDNCDGSNLGGGHTAGGFTDAQRGIWLPLSHSVTAPAGAKSVYIRPTALKEPKPSGTSAPETLVVLFDNIEFFETNDPAPEPIEDPAPDPVEEPAPQEDPAPEVPADDPQPQDDPQPEDDPAPEEPQDEPEDTPEVPETPEVPQVPEIPEFPGFPEFPGPDGGDDDPVVPQQPAPQVPGSQPTPAQPSTPAPAPEQPQAQEEATPATPTVTVPLPPATGTGPAVTGRSTLGAIALAIGAGLAGLGSVAAAAAIRRR